MEEDWPSPQITKSSRSHHGQRLRLPRSHNGCLTCKRRKVRCNEEKPRCGHCHRLDLRCDWKEARLGGRPRTTTNSPANGAADENAPEADMDKNFQWDAQNSVYSPLTELLDFASAIADQGGDIAPFRDAAQLDFQLFLMPNQWTTENATSSSGAPNAGSSLPAPPLITPSALPFAEPRGQDGLDMAAPPPILEMVENGPRWASAKALLSSMATASFMVRDSVMAFVALQLERSESRSRAVDYRPFYKRAAGELAKKTADPENGMPVIRGDDLKHILTTIFLLSYIDLLTDGFDAAHTHLRLAYKAVQWSERGSLGRAEHRVISWIRILDARAASAGGEGCFVNDQSGVYSPGDSQPSTGTNEAGTATSIEEVLYDMLCEPGAVFFQDVQSITGRITKIDHYHRSRGTVEDETEVMAIASEIQRDLAKLYEQRPALMDHAFAGHLGDNLLAPNLAKSIICSYRTYLANFYGCYIHIHRVAHRHLPRPPKLRESLCAMKELMHSMATSCDTLPVNVLWPLFLWGCEEDDPEQCQWIVDTIRSLEHVATNAHITADLLHEVHTRQRVCEARVDVRSVTVELFKANFAIM